MLRSAAVLALAAASLAGCSVAPSAAPSVPATGRLVGQVYSEFGGGPIVSNPSNGNGLGVVAAGTPVTVVSASGTRTTVQTDADGGFALTLPRGRYQVIVCGTTTTDVLPGSVTRVAPVCTAMLGSPRPSGGGQDQA